MKNGEGEAGEEEEVERRSNFQFCHRKCSLPNMTYLNRIFSHPLLSLNLHKSERCNIREKNKTRVCLRKA